MSRHAAQHSADQARYRRAAEPNEFTPVPARPTDGEISASAPVLVAVWLAASSPELFEVHSSNDDDQNAVGQDPCLVEIGVAEHRRISRAVVLVSIN